MTGLDNSTGQRTVLTDAQSSVRNAGLLMAQWTLHIAGAAAFAVLVPRMMGPDMFGRYSLLTSVALWFAFLSGLGAVSVLTRTIPQLVYAGDVAGLRRLATSLIALRGVTGLLTAIGYALLVTLALGYSDWPAVVLVAAAVWTRSAANISFALFLGLNQAARWGMGDLLRRWLILVFVVIGFPLGGLRGAAAGFFAANLVVLVVGLVQARPYLYRDQVDLSRRYLAPLVKIGTSFAAGNVLIAMVQRSGEAVLTVSSGDFTEVGYFGAAYAIYLTIAQALWQSAITFAPLLIKQAHGGEMEQVRVWLALILKWMLIVVCFVGAAILVLGRDLVPVLLGSPYTQVAANLVPLTIGLFFLTAGSVGRLAALALDRPAILVTAAAIELVTFWTFGMMFAPNGGSLAVCVGAAVATASYATWITWRMRRVMPYSPEAALRVATFALVFLPLVWAPFGLAVNALLFTVAGAAYGWLLWRYGIVTFEEIASLRRVARPMPTASQS